MKIKIFTLFLSLLLSLLSGQLWATADLSLLLIMDQSKNLSQTEFESEKKALIEALDQLPLKGELEFSTVGLDSNPKILVNLTQLNTISLPNVRSYLSASQYQGTTSNLTTAIIRAEDIFANSLAQRKVICLASGGFADNLPAANASAARLKAAGVVILPLGNNVNTQESAFLDGLASNPPALISTNSLSFSEVVTTGCIDNIKRMLALRSPLENGIEPNNQSMIIPIRDQNGTIINDKNRYQIVSFEATSNLGGTVTDNNDLTLTYHWPNPWLGSDHFKYTLRDQSNNTQSEGNINIVPIIANNDQITAQAGKPTTFTVLNNDLNLTGQDIIIHAFDQNSVQQGTISQINDTLVYTPKMGFSGTDSFTYKIQAMSGYLPTEEILVNNELRAINKATVTITINNPPIASSDTLSLTQDTSKTVSVLANDTDLDSNTLTIKIFDKISINNGKIIDNGNGSLSYTPATGFLGDDSFSYTVEDGKGGISVGTVNITVTIKAVANNDELITIEGEATQIDVLKNDTIGEINTVSISIDQTTEKGTLTYNGAGNFSYTPKANFVGVDSFSYTITDSNGATSTASVSIKINGADGAATVGGGSMEKVTLWLLLMLYLLHLAREHRVIIFNTLGYRKSIL